MEAAPLCELQGPDEAPAHLRPAAAGILTLTSGELRITGCLGGILCGFLWIHLMVRWDEVGRLGGARVVQ